jgi:hypothetical protein
MRGLMLGLALAFMALPALAQSPNDGLSGVWEGAYSYTDNRAPVPFIFEASVSGGQISGTISEPSTFGTAGVEFLHANVVGTIDGDVVRFTKTYDGIGGQTQSVQYQGVIDRSTQRVTGVWTLTGSTGQFAMTLTR